MISYIRGELAYVEEDKAVVDVQGVGYGIFMPSSALTMLPKPGREVRIYTYLNVREDCLQLFGFLSREDLEIFKLVIGVSGIGPKGGLAVLATLSPDQLRFAVIASDVKAISSAPGIGKKTAEKLILELKDKLDFERVLEQGQDSGADDMAYGSCQVQNEAVQALVALGYGSAESMKAVNSVTVTERTSVEDILKQALKLMMF